MLTTVENSRNYTAPTSQKEKVQLANESFIVSYETASSAQIRVVKTSIGRGGGVNPLAFRGNGNYWAVETQEISKEETIIALRDHA
jgi:hypothetical protein